MAQMMGSNPQQQMQLLQLLEEQSRMMAQILGPGAANQPAINPAFFPNRNQQPGKSLFDRVEGRPKHNGQFKGRPAPRNQDAMDTDAPAASADGEARKETSEVPCRFQLACTQPTCPFAHQSPAAPAGITMDATDKCSFGAACQNKKCAASHPSPAQRRQHLGSTVDCRFYPNCESLCLSPLMFPLPLPHRTALTLPPPGTNPSCPFRHPTTPPCRNGADCPTKDTGCKFSHSSIACRYNPCLNPACPYVHADGQKRGKFEDKVWTVEGFDRVAAEKADGLQAQHVSERRFVDEDAGEELILPGQSAGAGNGNGVVGGHGLLDREMGAPSRGASPASLGHADIVT